MMILTTRSSSLTMSMIHPRNVASGTFLRLHQLQHSNGQQSEPETHSVDRVDHDAHVGHGAAGACPAAGSPGWDRTGTLLVYEVSTVVKVEH